MGQIIGGFPVGGENLTPEVHENTDLINELLGKVVDKANPNGKYLWKKYEVTFVDGGVDATYPGLIESLPAEVNVCKGGKYTNGAFQPIEPSTRTVETVDTIFTDEEYKYWYHIRSNNTPILIADSYIRQEKDGAYAVHGRYYKEGKGDQIGYAVSDNETQYPDNGVHSDGLWYEKVTGAVGGVDVGTVNLVSSANKITVSHGLKVKPRYAVLIREQEGAGITSTIYPRMYSDMDREGMQSIRGISTSATLNRIVYQNFVVDETKIEFHVGNTNYAAGKFEWAAWA